MKLRTSLVGFLLLLFLVPSLTPVIAAADSTAGADPGAVTSAEADVSEPSDATEESWMGAIGAIVCGISVRVTMATGGTSVAAISVAVAACTFMVLDALVSHD